MNPYYDDLAVRANVATHSEARQRSATNVHRFRSARAVEPAHRTGRPSLRSLARRSLARRLPVLGSRRGDGGYVAPEPLAGRTPWGTGASV